MPEEVEAMAVELAERAEEVGEVGGEPLLEFRCERLLTLFDFLALAEDAGGNLAGLDRRGHLWWRTAGAADWQERATPAMIGEVRDLASTSDGRLLLGGSGGESGVKQADPVSFRDLQSVFPDQLAGWERDSPTGERMTQPVSFSEAMVTFTKGDASLVLKITDTGFSQLLLAPYAMFLTAGYEKETEDGYEKSTKVGDFPGWEKWNSKGKNGELNVIVNKRFMVQVEGSNVDDAKMMHEVMAAINLKKLGELKSDAPAAK